MAKHDAKDSLSIPGGWSEKIPADPKVQALCDSVKPVFEKKTGINVKTLEALTYKTQVVKGINYFIEVLLNGNEYWGLLIFEPLPCTGEKPRLIEAVPANTKEDAIQH